MGAGVRDTVQLSERVGVAQDAFIKRHLGAETVTEEIVDRKAGIITHSCDGLPLVGALPGAPRVLAMTAWGGWGLSAIGAAVEDLVAAILEQPEIPPSPRALLSPRRML